MKKLPGSKNWSLISMAILITIMSISSSCTKSSMSDMTGTGNTDETKGTGSPGTNEVWIQGMAFTPSTITVTAGTTVTWTNQDMVVHNAVSSPALFNSGSMAKGVTFSFKFSAAGTYSYTCTIHPSMVGTVVVN
jgi:plastocyanin